ncbi:hypothetical protein BKA70DRAFT_1291735 [Coprinopsis sp. MPI-PUGE-AT-0042]|nr:hypothetical protein BKA70DRAFT_1291735 [Coprinopsis sp. MPI-PUGE-AT-0042]
MASYDYEQIDRKSSYQWNIHNLKNRNIHIKKVTPIEFFGEDFALSDHLPDIPGKLLTDKDLSVKLDDLSGERLFKNHFVARHSGQAACNGLVKSILHLLDFDKKGYILLETASWPFEINIGGREVEAPPDVGLLKVTPHSHQWVLVCRCVSLNRGEDSIVNAFMAALGAFQQNVSVDKTLKSQTILGIGYYSGRVHLMKIPLTTVLLNELASKQPSSQEIVVEVLSPGEERPQSYSDNGLEELENRKEMFSYLQAFQTLLPPLDDLPIPYNHSQVAAAVGPPVHHLTMPDFSGIKSGREWTNEELKNLDIHLKHVGLEFFGDHDFSNGRPIVPGSLLTNANLEPGCETNKEARVFCDLYQLTKVTSFDRDATTNWITYLLNMLGATQSSCVALRGWGRRKDLYTSLGSTYAEADVTLYRPEGDGATFVSIHDKHMKKDDEVEAYDPIPPTIAAILAELSENSVYYPQATVERTILGIAWFATCPVFVKLCSSPERIKTTLYGASTDRKPLEVEAFDPRERYGRGMEDIECRRAIFGFLTAAMALCHPSGAENATGVGRRVRGLGK